MLFSMEVNVDIEELADTLVRNFTDKELIDFIMLLDEYACDWHLTEKLYKKFKKEHKAFERESKDGRLA